MGLALGVRGEVCSALGDTERAARSLEGALAVTRSLHDDEAHLAVQHSFLSAVRSAGGPLPDVDARIIASRLRHLVRNTAEESVNAFLRIGEVGGFADEVRGLVYEPCFSIGVLAAAGRLNVDSAAHMRTSIAALLDRMCHELRLTAREAYNVLVVARMLPDQRYVPSLLQLAHDARMAGTSISSIELGDCLRDAIASNQGNQDLVQEWAAMAHGREFSLFAGTPFDALQAIMLVPTPNGEVRASMLSICGTVLTVLIEELRSTGHRYPTLREALGKVRGRYRALRNIDHALIRIADEHDWPDWAIAALPRLAAPVGRDRATDRTEMLVWKPISAALAKTGHCRVLDSLCGGEMLRVSLDRQLHSPMRQLVQRLNSELSMCPYSSADAVKGVLADVLVDIEDETRQKTPDDPLLSTLHSARVSILSDVGVSLPGHLR
jgi:hypothetical protein